MLYPHRSEFFKQILAFMISKAPHWFVSLVVTVIPEKSLLRFARGYGYIAAAEKLIIRNINQSQKGRQFGPLILIGGVIRSGKSILATRIANENGFALISLDDIRNYLWWQNKYGYTERKKIKHDFMVKIASSRKAGLVIEGSDLIMDYLPLKSPSPLGRPIVRHLISLDCLLAIRERCGAITLSVGFSETDPETKMKAMLESPTMRECWACKKLSPDDLLKLTTRLIAQSRLLRALAAESAVSYYELDPLKFDSCINDVCRAVNSLIRASV